MRGIQIKRISQMNQKERRTLQRRLRALIQLLYFLFLPSAYTAAFSGVKYLFTTLGQGKHLELTSFVSVLVVLCLYTIVFGRFFCGFACAFGSLGDGIRAAFVAVMKRRKHKLIRIPARWTQVLQYGKYLVLCIISLLCFGGLYGKTAGMSPWDVFSMLHAGHIRLGAYLIGCVLLALIVIGMALEERFFCRFLCPMGAIFSLLPVLPLFTLGRDRSKCLKGCSACTRCCPSNISLPEGDRYDTCGECFQCQKCIGSCPKRNIGTGLHLLHGNEEWFTILRAVILLGLMIWLGI